ncbi:tetratricopeptide repeat protein [Deinococcus aquaedulcis]|uniref:tetratricopeptide repeat protein n=1 Tax=Deinococcus aquaedulcis TaxID=2840455 RepID=UPI001C83BA57|nr:tetratricopeptide repeat protein [Deinococcus aquaedulcis]
MTLRTLGSLSVEGVTFRREKVLLLLAYLCLEGPQPRRRLAELFWPEAANPMNSLAQHLVHLRGLPGALAEDGPRVAAGMPCDAALLREAARRGRAGEAAALYGGAFLDGLGIPLGNDLEEWVYDTREALALEARAALLTLASQAAARGQREGAGEYAARALGLPGAPPPDELDLPRLHHYLTLAGHPLATQVERDARTLGLDLGAAPQLDAAPFVGRDAQLAALAALAPGQLAWVSGHAGMGKTALLEALARSGGWTVLPGRADLPYGTLAPLCSAPPASAHAALAPLRDPHLKLAVDGWEQVDEATRAVLAQAARTRPGAVIVVTGRAHPPFDVDRHLHLGPLTEDELPDPALHRQTDGHPVLVGAALRGQPLDLRLGARVRAYPPATRDGFLLLALQDQPNLRATRAALGQTADDFARTLSFLTTEGLTNEAGRVYAAAATREHLHQIHVHAALLHLKLARALPEADAWPHYEQARDLWEDHDEVRAARAACLRAQTLLKRGYPGPAAALLDTLRDVPSLAVPHAWALIGVGRYNDAYARLEALPEQPQTRPDVLAVRATTLVRLGRVDEAVALADQIKGSGPEAAHAASVKGNAARIREQWAEARRHSQMAADLWQANGDDERELTELVMVARAHVRLGAEPQAAFAEILQAARDLPSVHGLALVNLAQVLLETGQSAEASEIMYQAVDVLTLSGDQIGLASALGNLAVSHHLQGQLREAAELYRRALHYLRGTGNVRHLGQTLSNLSEIEGDLSAFEDSLHMLEQAGHHELVAQIRRNAHIAAQSTGQPLRS